MNISALVQLALTLRHYNYTSYFEVRLADPRYEGFTRLGDRFASKKLWISTVPAMQGRDYIKYTEESTGKKLRHFWALKLIITTNYVIAG